MHNTPLPSWSSSLLASLTACTLGLATIPVRAQQPMYRPIPIVSGQVVEDILSEQDIPTGDGGFSRDYRIRLESKDQVTIDLMSDEFDTIVILLSADGSTIGENDDGPDGTTNSLLFARIVEGGYYIVRVRAFGETGGGKFTLKVTRLRPVDEDDATD
ncbi:peptidase [Spirulina subsalsa]